MPPRLHHFSVLVTGLGFLVAAQSCFAHDPHGPPGPGEPFRVDWFGRWSYGSYTFPEQDLTDTTGMNQSVVDTLEGSAPEHQWALRSQMNLPCGWTFDAGLRYVGSLSSPEIPAYVAMDARLAWQINEDLELSFTGQNLTDDQNPEFAPSIIAAPPTEVERSVYAKLTWRF